MGVGRAERRHGRRCDRRGGRAIWGTDRCRGGRSARSGLECHLARVGRLLREREREFGEIVQAETGKPWQNAVAEVASSAALADFMASEVDRYLGWPGQAISYKVGERVWLAARDAVQAREGAAFDLKEFHRRALDLGPMGLAQLQRELV